MRKDTGGPATPGSPGEYYWGASPGPFLDRPKLIAILMIQAPSQQPYYPGLVRMLVEQAIVE